LITAPSLWFSIRLRRTSLRALDETEIEAEAEAEAEAVEHRLVEMLPQPSVAEQRPVMLAQILVGRDQEAARGVGLTEPRWRLLPI